jgi:hypothetical protein
MEVRMADIERTVSTIERITYKIGEHALHRAVLDLLIEQNGHVFNETTKVIIRRNSCAEVVTEYARLTTEGEG